MRQNGTISLLQDFVLLHLAVAAILTILASLAISCSRKVQQRIETDWFLDDEGDGQQDEQQEELEDRGGFDSEVNDNCPSDLQNDPQVELSMLSEFFEPILSAYFGMDDSVQISTELVPSVEADAPTMRTNVSPMLAVSTPASPAILMSW